VGVLWGTGRCEVEETEEEKGRGERGKEEVRDARVGQPRGEMGWRARRRGRPSLRVPLD